MSKEHFTFPETGTPSLGQPHTPVGKNWEWETGVDLVQYRKQVLVAQSCLTLCDSMGCSRPGSSVHGILQARILE